MSRLIGLDFETYGAEDLPKHGLDRYVKHWTFRPLIASTCIKSLTSGALRRWRFDFVDDYDRARYELNAMIGGHTLVAHNAPFEQAVLRHMGIDLPASRFIDSAVVARAVGAGSGLEAAAPQLLGVDKLESGKSLMRLFSIPTKEMLDTGALAFDPQVVKDHPQEWAGYGHYCDVDAELGLRIVLDWSQLLPPQEAENMAITMDMNDVGWNVDIDSVEEMQRRYLENQAEALQKFRAGCNAPDLNLNSLKQLKEWCLERGVRANSFDEKHVARLLKAVSKKLDVTSTLAPGVADAYYDVEQLLLTKQTLGGSSLKKLVTILDTTGADGRLRGQYLHVGAGQSWRTTGRSVQMQNLKRLNGGGKNMATLMNMDSGWTNDQLAANIRQVFTATDPNGRLIVGDFSSVEARGLAYMAGEEWKLQAFRDGRDLYKVAAARQFGVGYDLVSKEQRMFGKVGELSCGYQAAGGAVQAFAEGMGVVLTEAEATKVVVDWREANPKIVDFWYMLDEMSHDVVEGGRQSRQLLLPDGLTLIIEQTMVPQSLLDQVTQDVCSLKLRVLYENGDPLLTRFFHGCYIRGRSICYYKPSDRKTGDLWRQTFVDPKTKQTRFYEIYGGKLAGILTQSFCREIFFRVLRDVSEWAKQHGNIQLVGQFHDEIVLDWSPMPAGLPLYETEAELTRMMSNNDRLPGFPLAAEVKSDYRYTK